jgi:hypothetical protein
LQYIVTSQEDDRPSSYRSASSSRPSSSSFEASLLDQHYLCEDAIRQHYQAWCAKFRRSPHDSFRFVVFQRNYLQQLKWNLAAGKAVFTLNEFADCTEGTCRLWWTDGWMDCWIAGGGSCWRWASLPPLTHSLATSPHSLTHSLTTSLQSLTHCNFIHLQRNTIAS